MLDIAFLCKSELLDNGFLCKVFTEVKKILLQKKEDKLLETYYLSVFNM